MSEIREPKADFFPRLTSEADVETIYPFHEGWRDEFHADPITTMGHRWPENYMVTRWRVRDGERVRISIATYVPAELA